ncbi:MAG: ferritin-like domain-containing protein [Pirellulales bacterium]|nr:ferritin-like domain-containing protein [Pirellulales bacterium]
MPANMDNTAILNQVLIMLNRSFAMYLHYAMPYFTQGDEQLRAAFENLVADQKSYVDKLGEMIIDRETRAEMGQFPMQYTDCHDLSIQYLIRELVRDQERDVRAFTRAVEFLRRDPAALALVEEILGNAQGHLETLSSLAKQQRPPSMISTNPLPNDSPATIRMSAAV